MGKLINILKRDKKEIIWTIVLTTFLLMAYMSYVLQAIKEIPFIYNQF
ncbi:MULTISPECIES: hypothetical protein [Clostridium]|nr:MULTISPECIES: hypothetical protein [Clostridium]MBS5308800.1 hypothetical protein [Clostridium sp.]MBS5885602.1 hypothetical protein [Clostridium sp.]MDB1941887.1 hypothetical protein [Clostridium tertium]MDB1944586.1 hypothetical protein [Clostridium tertium]MDB1951853.1 hypothetical protein [Clostridium tertium]